MKSLLQTKFLILFILFCWQVYLPVQAQSKSNFGVRAGYIYSTTEVKTTGNTLRLEGIDPKGGYYAGLMYGYAFSDRWLGRFELDYQNKGQVSKNQNGAVVAKNNYNYLGITPTIGVRAFKNLSFLAGPEINILLSKNTRWADAQPVEFGLVGSGSYQINRALLNIGYFKGLTSYDKTSIVASSFDFVNQNWQIGLTYLLK
jgi:hypothetical protein